MSVSKHIVRRSLAQALADFQNALSLEEKPKFQAQATRPDANAVLVFTSSLDQRRASSGRWCISSRLNDFLEAVRLFTNVVDTFVSSNPNVAALVWGSIKFTFLVAVNVSSYFEQLSKLIMELRNDYPRFSDYQTLFPDCPRLQAALSEYFALTVDFCRKVVEIYHRTALWKPFETEMLEFKRCIERQNKEVQQEIRFAADLAASKEREEQRFFRSQMAKISDQKARSNQELAKHRQIKANQKLLEKLASSYRHTPAFKRVKKSRLGETCSWITKSACFQSWLQTGSSQILACSGKMGCGKTVLCGWLIDYLLSDSSAFKFFDVGKVIYFFCQQQDVQSLDPNTIIGCLAKQLLSAESMLPQTKERLLDLLEDDSADLEELADFFIELVEANPCAIILDGLDECEQSSFTAILKMLRKLLDRNGSRVKIFVSAQSGFVNELQYWFEDLRQIVMSPGEVQRDISAYIKLALEHQKDENRLKVQGEEIMLEIQQTLYEKADGMFLWVHFQIEEICRQTSNHLIRETLKALPMTLTETYQRALDKVYRHGQMELVKREFQWISAVKRPLTLDEMNEALSIDPVEDVLLRDRLLNDPEQLVSLCCGLVSRDEDEQTLLFTHSSVLQFLTANAAPQPSSEWRFTDLEARMVVDKSCISYLNLPEHGRELTNYGRTTNKMMQLDLQQLVEAPSVANSIPSAMKLRSKFKTFRKGNQTPGLSFDVVSRMKDMAGISAYSEVPVNGYPFLVYARKYWLLHCTRFTDENSKEWRQFKKLLLGSRALAPLPWAMNDPENPLYQTTDQITGWVVENDHGALAAYLILYTWKGNYPPRSKMIEQAIRKGSIGVVKVLLENFDELSRLSQTLSSDSQIPTLFTLDIAAECGRLAIFDLILSSFPEPNDVSILHNLIALGLFSSAKMVASRVKDIDGRNTEGKTALHAAVELDRHDLVQALLAAGADVNAEDGERTILQAAADVGPPETVRLLLAANVDINATFKESDHTPLQIAVANGHLRVVQELLSSTFVHKGVDLAVLLAVNWGHLEMLPDLLAAKGQLDVNSSYYMGACKLAAMEDNDDALKLLHAKRDDVTRFGANI